MFLISNLSSSESQKTTINLQDGSQIILILRYMSNQYGWFIDSLTYKTVSINGMRITNNPNLLRQYRNKITFGIACITDGNREPSQLNDFFSGTSKLFILTSAEVSAYEASLIV